VRAEGEGGVAWESDAEAVGVGGWVGGGEGGAGGGGVPGGHEELLGEAEVGVGAGEELGGGPVEFEDLGVGGWECWRLWSVIVCFSIIVDTGILELGRFGYDIERYGCFENEVEIEGEDIK